MTNLEDEGGVPLIWDCVWEYICQKAEANAERGYPQSAWPAPELLELPWEDLIVPLGEVEWSVVEMSAPEEYRVHRVEPLAWGFFKYVKTDEEQYWWYGIGLHPTERTRLLFRQQVSASEVLDHLT